MKLSQLFEDAAMGSVGTACIAAVPTPIGPLATRIMTEPKKKKKRKFKRIVDK